MLKECKSPNTSLVAKSLHVVAPSTMSRFAANKLAVLIMTVTFLIVKNYLLCSNQLVAMNVDSLGKEDPIVFLFETKEKTKLFGYRFLFRMFL